ncbi:MAG: DUF2339 domain-containing protein [Candidatus Taylorbacteria bacterium]
MFTFLIIIVVVILFILQSRRIDRLEWLIKKLTQSTQQNSTHPQASSVQAPLTPMNDAVHTTPAPMNTATISPARESTPVMQQSAAPTAANEKDVSGEEVSGRILGRIGITAVIIGIAFFLKYAFDNDWIGPAGRVGIGLLIGTLVIILGQTLRKKYLKYSDLLMGGGLAILYLSVFASFALYQLVDPMPAFLGMIVVTAIGVALSIMNATETLSFIAFIGGFLAPILIGVTELGTWVTFTYISILNMGILGIMFYKKWNYLVLIGLFGSWIIFGTWLFSSYTIDALVPTLMFVFIQYAILTASSIIRIIVDKIKATEIDYLVLTATAMSFALVCYYLLNAEYKHYLSLGFVAISAVYIVIALIAYKENPADRTINIFLPGLAVSFLTAAVPIEFSGSWISAWWFVEAILLYILASKSSSRGFQIMGVVVYILGMISLLQYLSTYVRPDNYVVFFNAPFIMLIMAAVTAYLITFVYYRYGSLSSEIQKRGIAVFVIVANIITLYALTSQVIIYYELQQIGSVMDAQIRNESNTTVSILWALYAALLTIIGFVKRYMTPRRMGLILFIVTAMKVVVDVWSLGELYRIVSFIIFGVIALSASFLYVKYRDRLKDIV